MRLRAYPRGLAFPAVQQTREHPVLQRPLLVPHRPSVLADLELAALPHLRLPRRGPAGFVLEALDIRVVGTCERCRRPEGMQPKPKQHMI